MARPTGSKVIVCDDCGHKIVAKIGELGICKNCGSKVRFTKKLMKELGKKID